MSQRACATAVLASVVLACSRPHPTEIVVRIRSDLLVGTELLGVHVTVQRAGATQPVLDQDYALQGPSAFALPGEIGVVARDPSDHGQLAFTVSGRGPMAGRDVVVVRTASFTPGSTTVLDVFLARRCGDPSARSVCAPDQTSCGQCGCELVANGPLPLLGADAATASADAAATEGGACDPFLPPVRPTQLFDTDNPAGGLDAGVASTCLGSDGGVVAATDAGAGLVGSASVPVVRYFAMQRVAFDFPPISAAWRQHGFDFDGLCTDPTNTDPSSAPSCQPQGGAMPVPDGDRGRDNAFGGSIGVAISASINAAIAEGRATIGLRVTGYSGPDDGIVTVEMMPLIHGHRASSAFGVMPPSWDGTDVWHVDADHAYASDGSFRVSTDNAFTAAGVLVARLHPHTQVFFATNNGGPSPSYITLTISGGVLVGPIGCAGSGLGPLEVGAYLPIDELSPDLTSLGLCPGSLVYSTVDGFFRDNADLYVVGDTVTNAPSTPCNAVSVGFGSSWVPITRGCDETDTAITLQTSCGTDAGATDAGGD